MTDQNDQRVRRYVNPSMAPAELRAAIEYNASLEADRLSRKALGQDDHGSTSKKKGSGSSGAGHSTSARAVGGEDAVSAILTGAAVATAPALAPVILSNPDTVKTVTNTLFSFVKGR